jgi:hypothetical protein
LVKQGTDSLGGFIKQGTDSVGGLAKQGMGAVTNAMSPIKSEITGVTSSLGTEVGKAASGLTGSLSSMFGGGSTFGTGQSQSGSSVVKPMSMSAGVPSGLASVSSVRSSSRG